MQLMREKCQFQNMVFFLQNRLYLARSHASMKIPARKVAGASESCSHSVHCRLVASLNWKFLYSGNERE